MSLLNDALRDLEKRRHQEEGERASVPPGLRPGTSGEAAGFGGLVWPLVSLILLLCLLGGVWFWWTAAGSQAPAAEQTRTDATETFAAMPAQTEVPEPVAPVAEPLPAEPQQPEPERIEDAVSAPEPEAPDTERAIAAQAPEQAEQAMPAEEPVQAEAIPDAPAETVVAAAEPEAVDETPPEPRADEAPPPQVRQMSPQQQERALSRELEQMLARGDVETAESRLRGHLILDSDSPASRAVMARYWLRQDNPGRARYWLPDEVSALYPSLRLIRARMAVAASDPHQARDWLARSLPPVATHTQYHATLAALYQQLGDYGEAASVWAALIETDDARADWWAGLGIALESQGRRQSAISAFTQANNLPGLSGALRQYVEQRLANSGS